MLNSKFDLYKAEWLDLVFDNRNKQYGAYELRLHYGDTMTRAMITAFLGIGLSIGVVFAIHQMQPQEPVVKITSVPLNPPPVLATLKKVDPPKPKAAEVSPPVKPVSTTRYVPFVVKPTPEVETPPKADQITGAIGPANVKVAGDGPPAINVDPPSTGSGQGTVAKEDNSIHTVIGLESLPEPVGGSAAWSKFLQKNLRYPAVAQENGLSGRVILSFIIEKDGQISNVVVERPAGSGFDEEAARVLKMAKAWKPGIQNGQPVRVKFNIPINFTAAEQN